MSGWQHKLESAGFSLLMGAFKTLGRERASAFGGWLFRTIGPKISRHKKADASMARVLPDLTPQQRADYLSQMWDNLGRVAGEYPHLGSFTTGGPDADDADIEVLGADVLASFAEDGKSAIFVSGHFANWELMPLTVARAGVEGAEIYRAPNNPAVDAWITNARQQHIMAHQVPKGPSGARELVKCLKSGVSLCMLADQKMNDGIESTFFGRPAMSPAAPATMSLRYNVPIVPVTFERVAGTKFRIRFWPPLEHDKTGDMQADIAAITRKVNAFLEDWIRQRPGMWLWLHNRWPKD